MKTHRHMTFERNGKLFATAGTAGGVSLRLPLGVLPGLLLP